MQNNSVNQDVMADLMRDLIKEKRSNRRWKNFRFVLWFLLIALAIYLIAFQPDTKVLDEGDKGYVA
jgi:hypothetical protein